MKIKTDSFFFIHFFFCFLIVNTGYFPSPQLHPLQTYIHISHMVMIYWSGQQKLGCSLRSPIAKCVLWALPRNQMPLGVLAANITDLGGAGNRWRSSSWSSLLTLPMLTPCHYSFCWVPVLLEVMTVMAMPLKLCWLCKGKIIHQVSIALPLPPAPKLVIPWKWYTKWYIYIYVHLYIF